VSEMCVITRPDLCAAVDVVASSAPGSDGEAAANALPNIPAKLSMIASAHMGTVMQRACA